MSVKSLHVLYCGSLVLDKGSVLTYQVDIGKRVEVPILSYLIRTDEGNILFDTGVDCDDLKSKIKGLKVKEEDFIEEE